MASVVSGCRINFGVEAVPSWFTALQVRLGASLLNKQAGFALAVDTMWVRQVSSLCSLLACAAVARGMEPPWKLMKCVASARRIMGSVTE